MKEASGWINRAIPKLLHASSSRLPHIEAPSYNIEEQLVYEDDDLLVFNKPAGELSVPGLYGRESLATRVAKTWGVKDHHTVGDNARPSDGDAINSAQMIVHRLDQATSGLIVFARTLPALKALHRQFRQKQVHKVYSAVVHIDDYRASASGSGSGSGSGSSSSGLDRLRAGQVGLVSFPFQRDVVRGPPFMRCVKETEPESEPEAGEGTVPSVAPAPAPAPAVGLREVEKAKAKAKAKAKVSLTKWKCVRVFEEVGLALLDLEPLTGRTHQLRVHLAAAGMPICGDQLYSPHCLRIPPVAGPTAIMEEVEGKGTTSINSNSNSNSNRNSNRLLLHARVLELDHPTTRARMRFEVPLPVGFIPPL